MEYLSNKGMETKKIRGEILKTKNVPSRVIVLIALLCDRVEGLEKTVEILRSTSYFPIIWQNRG